MFADNPDVFASALAECERSDYVVVDHYTRAPITPVAPVKGRVGIAADVARSFPGLTAVKVADVSPAARAEYVAFLEDMHAHVWRGYNRNITLASSTTNERARVALRLRAQRHAEEARRYRLRALAVRATF